MLSLKRKNLPPTVCTRLPLSSCCLKETHHQQISIQRPTVAGMLDCTGTYIVGRHCENTPALPHDSGSPSTSSFGRLASKPVEHRHTEIRPGVRVSVLTGNRSKVASISLYWLCVEQIKRKKKCLDVKLGETTFFFPASRNIAPLRP